MDYYEKYNLKKVINASGKMTILGVSKYLKETIDAQKFGGEHFFEMSELSNHVGSYLAELLGVGAACIVSSASAGIAQSIAAIIGKGSNFHLYHPYTDKIRKREIILPKGQNVDYGTSVELMVQIGGGRVVEAGYANMCSSGHVEDMITEETAAILFIKSHHAVQKSMLSVKEAAEVAKKHNIPLIVDAAAEEDLFRYIEDGANLVIYSGAKAFEGPSSGLVIGDKELIKWTSMQANGIGRAMKIGKENILGLAAAIETYIEKGSESGFSMQKRLRPFVDNLGQISGINARIVQDGAGRDIYRAQIEVLNDAKLTAGEIVAAFKQGDLVIYTRDYQVNNGIIEIDVRSVNEEEMEIIEKRLVEILSE